MFIIYVRYSRWYCGNDRTQENDVDGAHYPFIHKMTSVELY